MYKLKLNLKNGVAYLQEYAEDIFPIWNNSIVSLDTCVQYPASVDKFFQSATILVLRGHTYPSTTTSTVSIDSFFSVKLYNPHKIWQLVGYVYFLSALVSNNHIILQIHV